MSKSSVIPDFLQQGIEQDVRERTIEGILKVLELRFGESSVQTLKPMLESIQELQRLKDLWHAACHVPSVDAFKRLLTSNGVEWCERFVKISQALLDAKRKPTKPMDAS